MINELLLLSGNDIPFPEARVSIHQPTIKEIAYIGEESFFLGCDFLTFSQEKLAEKDKNGLENVNNFDIIMSIMKDKSNIMAQQNRVNALLLLTIIFPNYTISLSDNEIVLKRENNYYYLNRDNFLKFQEILKDMFCLHKKSDNELDYNPANNLAREFAEKMRKGREIANRAKGINENSKIAILSRYVSILTIGLKEDMNSLLDYTVYQLFDAYQRFDLQYQFDLYVKQKLAGATDLEDVDNWMKDIHSESIDN